MAAAERFDLSKLARAARGNLLDVAAAAEALGVPRRTAALRLASLARRNWLRRVRRGLYLVLPLEAEPGRPAAAEDPWILAREAFSPCYIGGWSAAEHWGLTEQIFRSTLVVTAAATRSRSVELLGHEFRLFRVPKGRLRGTTLAWRGTERVAVSGPERTIVDGLRHPGLLGGARHLADIMREYGATPEHDFARLARVAREGRAGVVWKRLGYLAEILWPEERALLDEARRRMTAGNVRLDPGVRTRGRLVRRWRVWANVDVGVGATAA
ncbi:MAG: type IV toxin-antitoxin system AbiEi family antitoxin [Thermodesulfobacteriota bacterium]